MKTRVRLFKRVRRFAIAVVAALVASVAVADDTSLLHRREHENRPIAPVGIEVKYGVVTGTVTVRSGGELVNPQDVTFTFQPDFPGSQGNLYRVADGTYVLRAPRVPTDDNHTLVITGIYNDTIIRDGIVQRLGTTTSGTLRLEIPFGRDVYSFGDQLLDLR